MSDENSKQNSEVNYQSKYNNLPNYVALEFKKFDEEVIKYKNLSPSIQSRDDIISRVTIIENMINILHNIITEVAVLFNPKSKKEIEETTAKLLQNVSNNLDGIQNMPTQLVNSINLNELNTKKQMANTDIKSYDLNESEKQLVGQEDLLGLVGLYKTYKETKNIKDLTLLINTIKEFLTKEIDVFKLEKRFRNLREKVTDGGVKKTGVTFDQIEDTYNQIMSDEDLIENLKYFRYFQKQVVGKENNTSFKKYFADELTTDKLQKNVLNTYFTKFIDIITDINIIIDVYNKELKGQNKQSVERLGGSNKSRMFQHLIKDILKDW